MNPFGTTQSISCKSLPTFLKTEPCSAALTLPVSINPNSPKVLIISLPWVVSSNALAKVTLSLFFKSWELITTSFWLFNTCWIKESVTCFKFFESVNKSLNSFLFLSF